jgi:murein DD-endopeptidase MepM/ murein hydrolase activator NlpD
MNRWTRLLVVLAWCILLTVPSLMPVSAAGDPIRRLHIADGSKTLGQIARAYRVSLRDLALMNGLVPSEPLAPGLRLRLPPSSEAVEPIVGVVITPTVPGQGETLVFQVMTRAPMRLAAYFDDTPAAVDARGIGLAGVHPLATPGEHLLRVRATDAQGWMTEAIWPVRVAARSFDEQHIVLSDETRALLAPELVQAERRKLTAIWEKAEGTALWTGPFTYPLTIPLRLTTGFGTRRTYNDGQLYGFHEGLDYGAPTGTPVYAAANGRVVLAEPLAVRGNAVIVDHGMGVVSGYWHLSRIGTEVGQIVRQGDLLGWVGTTGLSTGPHLHWEVRIVGIPVDPRPWVERGFP